MKIKKEMVQPLLLWYEKNARVLPWRKDKNPYRVWVSEIMLQQTRVEAVIPYFNRFMKELPTIEALAKADEEQLHKLWEGLGYYSRVRNLQKAAQVICAEFNGVFPEKYDDILSLPGIGPYTVGAISSIAFEQPRAAVDGNVLRVMTRVLADGTDIGDLAFRKELGETLEKIYPEGKCGAFTQSLIELGASVCAPNGEPHCETCPISSMCKSYKNKTQLQYPVKAPKKKRKITEMTVFLLESGDEIAICKRPDQGLLASLWQFPNIEGVLSVQQAMDWAKEHEIKVSRMDEIVEEPQKKHIFTHVEWHMHVYRIQCERATDESVEDDKLKDENFKSDHSKDENVLRKKITFFDREGVRNGDLQWISKKELGKHVALPTAFRKLL